MTKVELGLAAISVLQHVRSLFWMVTVPKTDSTGALCHLYGKVGNNCKRIADSGIHIYEPSLVTYYSWIIVLNTLRKSIVRKTNLLQLFPHPTTGLLN